VTPRATPKRCWQIATVILSCVLMLERCAVAKRLGLSRGPAILSYIGFSTLASLIGAAVAGNRCLKDISKLPDTPLSMELKYKYAAIERSSSLHACLLVNTTPTRRMHRLYQIGSTSALDHSGESQTFKAFESVTGRTARTEQQQRNAVVSVDVDQNHAYYEPIVPKQGRMVPLDIKTDNNNDSDSSSSTSK